MRFFVIFITCLGFTISASAKVPTPTKETYKDLINIAENLSLQHDRLQATQILVRGLKKEKSLVARHELVRSLNELSEVFYSDKTQQIFEMGESLRFDSPQTAVDKYNEALKLEPGNLNILRGLARTQLSLGGCEKVSDLSQQALDTNPYSDDFLLLKAQALACLSRTKDSRSALEKVDSKKTPLKLFFDIVKVQDLFFEDKLGQAEDELKKVIDEDAKFPESYYWMAQIKLKQKADAVEWNQKYVRYCQNITPQTRRKYVFEPRLCQELKTVEQSMEQSQSGENI